MTQSNRKTPFKPKMLNRTIFEVFEAVKIQVVVF